MKITLIHYGVYWSILQWHLVLYESIPDRLATVSNQLSERLRKENSTRLTGWRLVFFACFMVAVGFAIGWQLSAVKSAAATQRGTTFY